MRNLILIIALCGGVLLNQVSAADSATVGQPAPNFTLQGSDGKEHSLADFKGKFIVLEWTNHQCPFVHKFYDGGAMQKLQKEETGKGVVWLRIISSAPGHEGYQTVPELAAFVKEKNIAATASLIDPDGKVGHLYGARTTPHMYVIDDKGVLVYAGGIDDKSMPNASDIASAKNYVTAALGEARAGKAVSVPTAQPYGCSVKYAK